VTAVRSARYDIDGVLLLNKPRGLSSQQAVAQVKRLYAARKAGHTGTLDPMADGLLPIGLGEATKFSQFVLDSDKGYLATLRLGATTTTGDAEGDILQELPVAVSFAAVATVLRSLTGAQVQTPPMHSAVKIGGKPLYAYARAGEVVERKARAIRIDDIQLVDLKEKTLVIRVLCSKGTYIRVLAEDIGAALGCGAHLVGLTRELAGPFELASAVSIDDLESMDMQLRMARLLQPDIFASSLLCLELETAAQRRINSGQVVEMPGTSPGLYRLYGVAGVFIGIGEIVAGELRARRLLSQLQSLPHNPEGLSKPVVTG